MTNSDAVDANVAVGGAAGGGRRARRRAAAKENKRTLKEADEAQKQKFEQINKEREEKEREKEEKKSGEEGEDGDDSMVDGSSSTLVDPSSSSSSSFELISDSISDLVSSQPGMSELVAIMERFQKRGEESIQTIDEDVLYSQQHAEKTKEERIDEEIRQQTGEAQDGTGDGTLSRRKQKERDRLAIADLKQLVSKPDVVELHDVASADPKLLVYLKSFRNTVPVPQHWCQKRKYLQNKRGYEKPPFQLPECIENTGISKMRGAQQEKDATATNKQKQRAKMQPKMGKIDIDYQILHDAFFRYQTKPPMTEHGALYYEGREHELKMTEKKPGQYSTALREALGMKEETAPPPWLLRMQSCGPPPAYPYLAIPGVSAPIPAGARYGFGEGEWGKPPVDANGRPLYGDVFGVERRTAAEIEQIDRTAWGALESEDDGDEEPDEEEDQSPDADETLTADAAADGTASTMSAMSGLTTPEVLNLRKSADGTGTETPDTIAQKPKNLYQVLEEKKITGQSGGVIFGSQHTYVMPDGNAQMSLQSQLTDQEKRVLAQQAKNRGQVDVALNPDELDSLDAHALKRKYDTRIQEDAEATKKALTAADNDDDDEDGQRKKKRKKGGEKDKAYKDFKF